jgi:hypothetical protein
MKSIISSITRRMNRAIGFSQPIIPNPCHFPQYALDPKEKAQAIRQKWDPVSRRLIDCPINIVGPPPPPPPPPPPTYSLFYNYSDYLNTIIVNSFPDTGFTYSSYPGYAAIAVDSANTNIYGFVLSSQDVNGDETNIINNITTGTNVTVTFSYNSVSYTFTVANNIQQDATTFLLVPTAIIQFDHGSSLSSTNITFSFATY